MKSILVIDDDLTFPQLVKTAMDPAKYTVTTATDGEKGFEAAKSVHPDLILCDIKMPNMGGIEFLKKLREAEGAHKTPVIITSNDASIDTISQGTEYGIRGYILKSNESLKTIIDIV